MDLNSVAGDWGHHQIANTALKRYGHVDDIAACVAGAEAAYITGANLTDGGTNARIVRSTTLPARVTSL
jgi:3-oxoacyl-[acyl-carrier protein] reductase